MKTLKSQSRRISFRYLLFLPFLFFTFCEEDKEIVTISPDTEQTITKDSKVVSLMMEAIKETQMSSKSDDDGNDDDDDEQCVEFEYPIVFYTIYPGANSIEAVVINNDQELMEFFDALSSTDQIQIDFPLVLNGTDGEAVTVSNLTELEETLEYALANCRDDDDDDDDEYDYCNDKKTKVYICHNGHTICVSVNAIQAHLDHGDELGECDD